MAYIRCIGGSGGGGTPTVDITPIKGFYESGIQSSKWRSTDDTKDVTRGSGTYTAVVGEYVEVNSSNSLLMRFDVVGSYYMFGIKCWIDPTFTPVNTQNWYQASCVLGQELGGQQQDFGIIIDKDGYFALGWANSSITSSDVSALDGNVHSLFVIADTTGLYLFVDGVQKVHETITMSGIQLYNMGIMYNSDNGNTRINGKVYRVGYFSTVKINGSYVVPNW